MTKDAGVKSKASVKFIESSAKGPYNEKVFGMLTL
jgi:hypothetical protein